MAMMFMEEHPVSQKTAPYLRLFGGKKVPLPCNWDINPASLRVKVLEKNFPYAQLTLMISKWERYSHIREFILLAISKIACQHIQDEIHCINVFSTILPKNSSYFSKLELREFIKNFILLVSKPYAKDDLALLKKKPQEDYDAPSRIVDDITVDYRSPSTRPCKPIQSNNINTVVDKVLSGMVASNLALFREKEPRDKIIIVDEGLEIDY